jgi:hypothetical protein
VLSAHSQPRPARHAELLASTGIGQAINRIDTEQYVHAEIAPAASAAPAPVVVVANLSLASHFPFHLISTASAPTHLEIVNEDCQ